MDLATIKPYLISGVVGGGAYVIINSLIKEGDYDMSEVNWSRVGVVAVIASLYAVQVKARVEDKAFELIGV